MKNLKNKLIIIAGLMVLTIAVNAQKSYLLQYGFKKGSSYSYKIENNSKQTIEMPGREIKNVVEISSLTKLMVNSIAKDGKMTIICNLEEAKIKQSMPKDTTIGIKDKGKSEIILDRSGKRLNLNILDSIKNNDEKMMINVAFEIIRFPNLPVKKVKIGEKWNTSSIDSANTKLPAGFSITTKNEIEYTVIQVETKNNHNCLKVNYSGKQHISGKGNQMGAELFMEGTGKVNGTFYFDPKLSILISDESSTDMESTIAVTGQQSMTIPVSQSLKSTTTLIEK